MSIKHENKQAFIATYLTSNQNYNVLASNKKLSNWPEV